MAQTLEQQEKIWEYFQSQGLSHFAGALPRHRYLLRRIARYAQPPAATLNIGAGDGHLELELRRRGYASHSLDPDAPAIARLAAAGIEARQGGIEAIPFGDAHFDVVICTEVFEHLSAAQWQAGLREIRRVLKPGGVLVGTVPFRETLPASTVICPHCGEQFHRWGHQQSFDRASFHQGMLAGGANWECREMQARHFWAWGQVNWKGKLAALAKTAGNRVGVHGSNENLAFAYRRR